MKVYIVRHGETPHNALGIYNNENEELTDKGIMQTLELRDKIKDMKFDIVISSPLLRTMHTENILTYYDDSIIVDADEELEKRILLMQNGLASKVENRMWYFGETERQAREALAQIDSEQQQSQQMAMMNQYDLNNRVMNGQNPDNKVKETDETKEKKGSNFGNKK